MSGNRVPSAAITGLCGAMVKRMTKKMLGRVPRSLGVMAQSTVLRALFGGPHVAQDADLAETRRATVPAA